MQPDLTLKIVVAVAIALGVGILLFVSAPLVRGALLLALVLGITTWYNRRTS